MSQDYPKRKVKIIFAWLHKKTDRGFRWLTFVNEIVTTTLELDESLMAEVIRFFGFRWQTVPVKTTTYEAKQ